MLNEIQSANERIAELEKKLAASEAEVRDLKGNMADAQNDHVKEMLELAGKLAVAVEAMTEAKDDVFNYYDEQGDVMYNAISIDQKEKLEVALSKIRGDGGEKV